MRSIVDTALASGSDVLMVTVLPVCCGRPGPNLEDRNLLIGDYNRGLAELADSRGLGLADINTLFETHPLGVGSILADGIHPNDIGYDVIAEALRDVLEESGIY